MSLKATAPAKTAPATFASSKVARHIARVAAKLFATKGYDATSVRDIVAAAEVTKPTLYYHFGSKQGLAEALLTLPMTRLIDALGEVLAGAETAKEKMAGCIETQFAFCREDPDRARFVYALFFGPAGAALSAELAEYGQTLTQLLARAIEGLAREAIIDPDSQARSTAALRGLVTIYTMDYLYRDLDLDEGLARRLVDDLIRGFGRSTIQGRAVSGQK